MIKAIIFDFDGVISESVNIKTNAFSEIYSDYGDEVVNKVVSHHLENGGISRYEKFKFYHEKFLGITLDDIELIKLSNQFSNIILSKVLNAPYVPGAIEFIDTNYKLFDFFISTGTPEDEIIEILNRKEINHYFKSAYGSPVEKTAHVKKIISRNGYNTNEVLFIGDSDTDILAAKNNDIPIIFRYHTNTKITSNYNKLIKVNDLKKIHKILLTIK